MVGAIIFWLLVKYVWGGSMFSSVPLVSWATGAFLGEPPSFYLGRLVQYAPVYLFGYFNLMTYHPKEDYGVSFLRWSFWLGMLFFIIWGGYQCRYILPIIPVLIVLSVYVIERCYEYLSSRDNLLGNLGRYVLTLLIVCFLLKSFYINLGVSIKNDFCYF